MNAPRNTHSEFKERELDLHESRLLVHEAQRRLPETKPFLESPMGLPISRSIIESHGGRLWATPNTVPGATFQFVLRIEPSARQTV